MYIAPNTDIVILRNVPLDTTYDHTIYFANATAQYNYFYRLRKYALTNQSYQRVKRGWMRINIRAENLYDCNYLMFRNTSFGNRWFYAFIKSVEYVNNEVSEVSFELDVMQTWMFDYTLEQCFVVREHSVTDEIGDNLLPEPVNIGQYIYDNKYNLVSENTDIRWLIVIVSTGEISNLLPKCVEGGFLSGTYHQAKFYSTDIDARNLGSTLRQLFDNLAIFNNTDIVIDFYLIPNALRSWGNDGTLESDYDDSLDSAKLKTVTLPYNMLPNVNPMYVAKNNKLYTYPYCYLSVCNNEGVEETYKYEFFENTIDDHDHRVIKFHLYSDGSVEPIIGCIPKNYLRNSTHVNNGVTTSYDLNNAITITKYPKCTWATNDYTAKLAQIGIWGTLALLTQGVTVGSGTIPGTSALEYSFGGTNRGAITNFEQNKSLVPYTGSMMNSFNIPGQAEATENVRYRANKKDAAAAGAIGQAAFSYHTTTKSGVGNLAYAIQDFGFIARRIMVAPQYAKVIDDYFSMYGYATNQLKIPNTHSRPHWNYVRTANCTIRGSIPADDANAICNIYDSGITFWKNGNEVGNYSLDNSPVSNS